MAKNKKLTNIEFAYLQGRLDTIQQLLSATRNAGFMSKNTALIKEVEKIFKELTLYSELNWQTNSLENKTDIGVSELN